MAQNVQIRITAQDDASGVFRNLGDVARGAFSFALGGLILEGFDTATAAIKGLAGEAFNAVASYEKMQMSIESLTAREIKNANAGMTMAEALKLAGPAAEDLLGWVQQLAIKSPFSARDVANAMQMTMAFGFNVAESKRLNQAMIDFAAATGKGSDKMQLIALALGQVKAAGRLTGQELRQLTENGIPAVEILATKLGVKLAEIPKMVRDGSIDANTAIEAIISSMETDWGGAAARTTTKLDGLVSTLGDIKDVSLRNIFTAAFQEAEPVVGKLVDKIASPDFQTSLKAIGTQLGEKVRGGLEWLQGTGIPAVQNFINTLKTGDLAQTLERITGAFKEKGMMGGFGQIGAELAAQWPAIQAALADWATKFWNWLTGPGGAIDATATQMDKLSGAMLIWASRPETKKALEDIGNVTAGIMVDGMENFVKGGQAGAGEAGKQAGPMARLAGAMLNMVGTMEVVLVAIGYRIGKGIIDGILDEIKSKETQKKLEDTLNDLFLKVNENLNPIHLLFDLTGARGLLGFASGGVVPGPLGMPQLAIVHGGETIIPAGATNNYNLTINSNSPIEPIIGDFRMLQSLAGV